MHTPIGSSPDRPAAERTADPLVGVLLEERYRVDGLMARGGMSTVYRGVDLRLERPVAIKVMTPQYAADPTFLARFEREARAAAKLDDPHVVGVFDQGRDGDHVFLVMELVDGGTLRDVLHQRGALSVRQALSVLEPILGALAAAHRAGLVHRDVKPENVLISTKGEVKVADFGLVRAVTSTTMATGDVILGTVAYLSPEQVETGASDERSDVYSAGIVAYEMLAGHPPFRGDNALSVAYQHVHFDVPPVGDAAPGVPVAIAEAIDAATQRDPLLRPANAAEFLAAVRAARVGMGLSLVPVPTPAPRPEDPPRLAPTARATAVQPSVERPLRQAQARTAAQQRRRRLLRVRLIALAVVLLVLAGAAVGGWWLANQWTSMPAVLDHPQAEAVAAIKKAGLAVALTTRVDNVIPSGMVADADPPADTRQRKGATVSLVISAGRPVVPEIPAGTPRESAAEMVRAAGLTPVVDSATNIYDDVLAVGTVVRTDPAAGQRVDIGSAVTLVLSQGPRPEPVPPVAGKMAEDAANKLLVAGFTVGPTSSVFDADVPAGTVIGTDPAEGRTAPHGSPVSLIVAVSVTVPEVGAGAAADIVATLKSDGFDASLGDAVFDPAIPGGDVVRIEPAPGTRIDPEHPVVTVIASTAVTTPPVIGLTVSRARDILTDAGLDVRVRSLFGSDGAIVTSQDPQAGTLVEPGSTVRLDAWP